MGVGMCTTGTHEAAERAMARAAAIAHEDLKCGLSTLATITCAAPLVGALGTIWALSFNTFLGISGERSSDMAALAQRISFACVPMSLGILVGLQALWIHRYLGARLERCDVEIRAASLRFLNLGTSIVTLFAAQRNRAQ